MPIQLIWGDDYEACNREIEEIIANVIDPVWKSFNFSQIDGNDQKQSFRALEEVQSSPFGNGGRVVIVRRSPFCNALMAFSQAWELNLMHDCKLKSPLE